MKNAFKNSVGALALSGVLFSAAMPRPVVAGMVVDTEPAVGVVAADLAITGTVVEFYHAGLDHYFITANPAEATAVDNGSAGAGWVRTGYSFPAGGSAAVCRFYGSMSPGPNSHFYTADPAECAGLKALQASTPDTQKRWNYEGLDFSTTPQTKVQNAPNGTCGAGMQPLYRAYNNGFARGVDSNHRMSRSMAAIQEVVARGWINEGVVGCVPESALPSVLPSNYAVGSEQRAAFDAFNEFRRGFGLNSLVQNAALDVSAQSHANYSTLNQVFGHSEELGKPAFSGVTTADRAMAAGYGATTVGEVGAATTGSNAVKGLINTIYHRSNLLDQYAADIGIGRTADWIQPLFVDYGYRVMPVAVGVNFLSTYPFDGQGSVFYSMSLESPNPFPSVVSVTTETSSPISIAARRGSTLVTTKFNVTEVGQVGPLPVRLMTRAEDPFGFVQAHEAYIVGYAPFKTATLYQVVFEGKVDGVVVSKTWSFTTRS